MEDIICACATSLGNGAINIIRISGNGAIELVASIFAGKNLKKVASHTIHYGFIKDGNKRIDEVLVSIFRAPKTYTKEDIVEINCHGSVISVENIIKVLVKKGCRMADKGEFTKRAFLNGRIDLIEAEAVQNIISANSNIAHDIALNQVQGNLSTLIKNIRNLLIDLISNIEVNIDYPEYEDINVMSIQDLKNKLPIVICDLKELLTNSLKSKVVKNGIKVALVGKPNVGKSSLLNVLMNEEKAIVTDIAGTTRDLVEGSIYLDNILVNFIDTAGLRDTNNKIEQIGIEKSKKIIDTSDLVVYLLDYSKKITPEELHNIQAICKDKLIIFINKNDQKKIIDLSVLDGYIVIIGNTLNNQNSGIIELKKQISSIFKLTELSKSDLNVLTNVNNISLIENCLNILENCLEKANSDIPIDMLEIDLKIVWQQLGEIIGETYNEELLDEMFSRFCLGK